MRLRFGKLGAKKGKNILDPELAAILGFLLYGTILVSMITATVSLVRIARRLGELVGVCADLKRELEEMKRKE